MLRLKGKALFEAQSAGRTAHPKGSLGFYRVVLVGWEGGAEGKGNAVSKYSL